MRFGTARAGTFRFDGVSSLIFTYNGTASLSIPHPVLAGTFHFSPPVYVGQANLKINQIQFAGTAKRFLPVYTGSATLRPNIVFVSVGKNIVEGFIYNEILYVTDTVVSQRNVETSVMILGV